MPNDPKTAKWDAAIKLVRETIQKTAQELKGKHDKRAEKMDGIKKRSELLNSNEKKFNTLMDEILKFDKD